MPTPAEQPRFDQPVVDQSGRVTQSWANYFLRMASAQSSDDLRALYEALAARVAELEDGQDLNFQILGQQSVTVNGVVQPGGVVIITLQGDTAAPGNTQYYGTGPTGTKGWLPISGAILVAAGELTKTVGSDGVTTFGLADVADSGAGVLLAATFDAKGRKTGSRPATITGTATQINVANGNASAGLPTLSLASEVLASLGKADSAVQSVVAGVGITVNNTDPRNPVVSAPGSGFAPPPTDGNPYVGLNGTWEKTNAPDSRFWLIEYPLLTDQVGNQLTDQAGNFLMGNSPIIPPGWPSTTTVINNVSSGSLQSMTLAQANALASPSDFQMVAITDLTGGREPCWYDATVASGTKWRRFSDRSIAN
ncbi:TPA: hypothetical protein R4K21_003220 [Stenotrophomonas maltophilia]|nr:hypothetical protein [Stenotrophomonas maltophilia]